jgi:hypothetical protein
VVLLDAWSTLPDESVVDRSSQLWVLQLLESPVNTPGLERFKGKVRMLHKGMWGCSIWVCGSAPNGCVELLHSGTWSCYTGDGGVDKLWRLKQPACQCEPYPLGKRDLLLKDAWSCSSWEYGVTALGNVELAYSGMWGCSTRVCGSASIE